MKQPNILLIVVDALRARNLSCYGYHKHTSSNIDRLAKEGVLFEKAFSCATTTYPSLATIFSGRYPRSHGVQKQEIRISSSGKMAQRLNTSQTVMLAEILKSKGYVTFGVDWMGKWTKRGFDYYSGGATSRNLMVYSLLRRINKAVNSRIIRNLIIRRGKLKVYGRAVTAEATRLVEKFHDRKFFLFAHYWDTHSVYDPPKSYVGRFVDYGHYNDMNLGEISNKFNPRIHFQNRIPPGTKTVGEVLARYDGSISYVDGQIGILLKTLENYGILDRTLVMVTSDHGESLTEHGIYFCHHGLYDATIHVPFVMRYCDFPSGIKIKALTQHIDIVPTVLNVLEMGDQNQLIDGKSTVPLIFDKVKRLRKAAYIEETETERKAAIRTDRYKYIYSSSLDDATCRECGYIHGGVEELYDLKQDKEEISNIVRKNPELQGELREKLLRWMKHLKEKTAQNMKEGKQEIEDSSVQEEKAIEERLRALGYLD